MTKIKMTIVNHERPTKKVRDYDHDMAGAEAPARDLIAGDLVPGLGILDAILVTDSSVLLCSGETAWEHQADDYIDVFPAMCKVCAMHPIDCEWYGCDAEPWL